MTSKFIAAALAFFGFANAQSQTPAPRMEFDVASVKQNKSDAKPVINFPAGPEDAAIPSGGLFSGSGVTLYQ
jgi:hypothetical protein